MNSKRYLLLWGLLISSICSAQRYNRLYPIIRYVKTDAYNSTYKLGYKDANNKLVVETIYDDNGNANRFFTDGIAVVNKSGLYGAIDTTGKVVIPIVYSQLNSLADGSIWAGTFGNDSSVLFDLKGHTYYNGYGLPEVHKAINRIFVNYTGRYSFGKVAPFALLLDLQGNKLAEFKGEDASINLYMTETNQYLYKALAVMNNKQGYITDLNGKVMYESSLNLGFQLGELTLRDTDRAAVIDTNFREVIPFSAGYKRIDRLLELDYFYVYKDSGWGLIDRAMKVIVPCTLKNELGNYSRYWFETRDERNGLFSYYNYKGEKILDNTKRACIEYGMNIPSLDAYFYGRRFFPTVLKPDEHTYRLYKNNGFCSKPHNYISPFNMEGFAYFSDSAAHGIIDTDGNELFTTRYPYLAIPEQGLAAAAELVKCPECKQYPCGQDASVLSHFNDKGVYRFFYLNLKGEKVNNEKYDVVYPYTDGRAIVENNCSTYTINKAGAHAAGASNSFFSDFAHGVRIVKNKTNQLALVDKNDKIVSPWVSSFNVTKGAYNRYVFFYKDKTEPEKPVYPFFNNGLVIFAQNGKYGLLDTLGNIKVKAEYAHIEYREKYYLVNMASPPGRSFGVIDTNGNLRVKPEYYEITAVFEPFHFTLVKKEGEEPMIFVMDDKKK